MTNFKKDNNNYVEENDFDYVDENGEPLTADEVKAINKENELHEKNNGFIEHDSNEYKEEVKETTSNKKRSFADLASSEDAKSIFKVKDNVDNLINEGKNIKDVFIKEANLLETEEAERLMREAFEKVEDLRDRKTGFLAISDKYLPESVNKLVQTAAMKAEQKTRNDKDIVQISDDLFGLMKKKQEDVENTAVKFIDIKNQMEKTVLQLSQEAKELELVKNNGDLSENDIWNAERVLTLISNNILTFKENIQNINAAQNMAMQCIMHIDQMLPTIENSMKDSLAVNGFLDKINKFKNNFTVIAEITNKIQDNNSESIHNMIRSTGDFDKILQTNIKGIERRTEAKARLTLEMKEQSTKDKQSAARLRNAIVDAQESMNKNQAEVFLDGEEVGEYYVPQRIDLNNQLENNPSKKTVRKVKKVVIKKEV